MKEKTIIYGITNLGLLFVPESRAKELAESNKALLTAKTWGVQVVSANGAVRVLSDKIKLPRRSVRA